MSPRGIARTFLLAPTRIQEVRFKYRIPTDLEGDRAFYLPHLAAYSVEWQTAALDLDLSTLLPEGKKLLSSTDNAVNPDITETEKPYIQLQQIHGSYADGAVIELAKKSTGIPQVVRALKIRLTDQ